MKLYLRSLAALNTANDASVEVVGSLARTVKEFDNVVVANRLMTNLCGGEITDSLWNVNAFHFSLIMRTTKFWYQTN